jgi:hypothetical protein
MALGFVKLQPLPRVYGLGAYQIRQMPERVMEGNKVPYGPMLAQQLYPFRAFDTTTWHTGPVLPMDKLTESPISPVLQNVGPLIAAPVTVPEGAYPQLGDTVGTMKWGVIGLIVLAGAAYLFYKERKR